VHITAVSTRPFYAAGLDRGQRAPWKNVIKILRKGIKRIAKFNGWLIGQCHGILSGALARTVYSTLWSLVIQQSLINGGTIIEQPIRVYMWSLWQNAILF